MSRHRSRHGGLKRASTTQAKDVKEEETVRYKDVDVPIRENVERVWNVAEEQCKQVHSEHLKTSAKQTSPSITGWKIVRVFVSSTFSDFFNEREVLVKKVFPELREWCKERGLKLVECDLRWGVPKDSSTAETILICLEEIDKCCDDDNQGQPLFITLLGDRYGWIPPISDVPAKARTDYAWIEGASITCMEILHGAYRTKNSNAGFFIRNSSVYENIPESKRSRFVDENPLNRHHVQVLKDKISKAFPTQVFDYEVSYKQLSSNTGKERVELTDFEAFANNVLDFLMVSIAKSYPYQSCVELSPLVKEEEAQWLYALDQASNLIGRKREKEVLLEFLSTGSSKEFERTADSSSSIRQRSEWDLQDEDQPVYVLEAPGGWGKTTLLCSVIKQAVENGWHVFYHIVGSTSSSNRVECLLKRLVAVFNSATTDPEKSAIESETVAVMKDRLRKSLTDFRLKSSEKLIIVIDGVNMLDNSETIAHLSWLPPSLPCNVRCIVSTDQHLPTLSRLYEHCTLKMTLATMKHNELSEIALQYLSTYSKKLDSHQLDHIISQSKVDNPLWLTLMAEELRIFGDFALIDQRISQFPSSMDELLIQIIDRLITEDEEQGLVKKVLCLIACSTHGLPADYARQICGNPKIKEEVAQLYWLQTQRLLSPYLRTSGFLGEIIRFSHEVVTQAVYKRLLSSETDICHWHTVLADFYQYWCDDGRLKVVHLPKHLKRAHLHQRMVEFMRKDRNSYFYMSPWQRSHLLRDARCRSLADQVLPGTAPMMLCHSCAMQSRSFNTACSWSNQKCCVICSQLCQSTRVAKAYACSMHANRRGKDMVKCVLCNFSINTKITSGPLVPFPALLCSDCAFGQGHKTCAVLKT